MTSRRDMADDLALSPASPTRTYVIEAHPADPQACLATLSGDIEPTADVNLFRARTEVGEFWVDQLDGRFWRFHTNAKNKVAFPLLREWVGSRRDLDWMWLPSQHLRGMWPGAKPRKAYSVFQGSGLVSSQAQAQDVRVQATGRDAEHLLDSIEGLPEYRSAISLDGVELDIEDRNYGVVREAVKRMGRFSATGDDLSLHMTFVDGVVDRYRGLVETCERKALVWASRESGEPGGGTVRGGPILLRFSREIDDLEGFTDELISCSEPFRLWGAATASRGIMEIEAVDLHVGQMLQLDISKNWMRIYLGEGACGNTVARLISNLQHRFDGALQPADPEIAEAVGVGASAR